MFDFIIIIKHLKRILDKATDGVIIISWGSIVKSSSMSDEKRTAIARALEKFNQTIVWKWETDMFADKPKNVFLEKWLPQRDILCEYHRRRIQVDLKSLVECYRNADRLSNYT